MTQETPEVAPNTAEKPRGAPFVAGDDPRRNMNGRPLGAKNFTTDFENALKYLNQSRSEHDQLTMEKIVATGMVKMLKGDARFEGLYKDLLDRYYGKPVQSIDHTTAGQALTPSAEQQALANSAIDALLNGHQRDTTAQ